MAEKSTNQSDALQGMKNYLNKDENASLEAVLAYLNANKNGRRYRLIITHNGKAFEPVIKGDITLELERFGTPGKLSFTTIKSVTVDMSFQEGDRVIFAVADKKSNGELSDYKGLFVGYVFNKKRDKQHHIEVTCYDQTRYLKNRFSYVFENQTATQIIKSICDDYGLKVGSLEDTKYAIPYIAEENAEAYDVIIEALEETLATTGEMYIFRDEAGTLKLTNATSMISDVMIQQDTAENFDYETSIDRETYNSVVLYYKPETVAQTVATDGTGTTDVSATNFDDAYYASAGATGTAKGGINVIKVVNWARAQLGKSSIQALHKGGGYHKTAGYCAGFVNSAFYAGGARSGFIAYPNAVVGRLVPSYTKSDGHPPLGACVFFRGSAFRTATQRYGHIGISLGNGQFIHAIRTVQIANLNVNATGYLQYYGWGWFNGVNLGTKPTSSSGKSNNVGNASKSTGKKSGSAAGTFLNELMKNIKR